MCSFIDIDRYPPYLECESHAATNIAIVGIVDIGAVIHSANGDVRCHIQTGTNFPSEPTILIIS